MQLMKKEKGKEKENLDKEGKQKHLYICLFSAVNCMQKKKKEKA